MTELQVLWAWLTARVAKVRDNGDDPGFTTLEWVAIAGVVIIAAIVGANILGNKGKGGANNATVQ